MYVYVFSDLMENGSVPVIDSSKLPKSLSVLPENNNMESIVWQKCAKVIYKLLFPNHL